MHTYISLLRGINVSGQKPVRMLELKMLYETLGFAQVVTYVQSGNVVFDSIETDRSMIAARIETGIHQAFGFQVPVFVRDGMDFQRITTGNPFLRRKEVSVERLYVTFLSAPGGETVFDNLDIQVATADEFQISGSEIYLYCPGGYGKTVLSNNFFERKLGQLATTRNWKTITALSGLSNARI